MGIFVSSLPSSREYCEIQKKECICKFLEKKKILDLCMFPSKLLSADVLWKAIFVGLTLYKLMFPSHILKLR